MTLFKKENKTKLRLPYFRGNTQILYKENRKMLFGAHKEKPKEKKFTNKVFVVFVISNFL
jgi:hypothetical protein